MFDIEKIDDTEQTFAINLQLFGTDPDKDEEEHEDVDDGGYAGDPDEKEDPEDQEDPDDKDPDADEKDPDEDTDPEDNPDDEDPDDQEDEDPDSDPDKKPKKQEKRKPTPAERALIEQKRINKELQKKLKEIEDQKREDAEKTANEQRIQDLIKEGYGEAQARQIVGGESANRKLERELQLLKFEKLEKKYPGISDHADMILDIQKKSNNTLSVEEIYLAKFRTTSEYDIKTKTEAATLHKQKEAKNKSGVTAQGGSDKKPVKLSPSDERSYQYLTKQKQFKNLTRAQYLKMLRGGELE